MRTIINTTALISIIALTFVTGCQQSAQIEDKPLCFAQNDKQKAFDACKKVLKDMHFTIDKLDIDNDYISTNPLSGGELLEFWRTDNVTSADKMRSSLHSIRRTVELQLTEKVGTFCVDCTVSVERLSMPTRKVASYSELPSMFSKSSASRQRLHVRKSMERQMTWVPLDDDTNLAALIKQNIKQQLAK
jgi:hypothetical protein